MTKCFSDGALSATCFHSGYFLLQNLYPLVVDPSKGGLPGDKATKTDEYNKYVADFCDKFEQTLPARSLFVRTLINEYELAAPDQKQAAVMKKCDTEISTQALLNTWFDPIDPLGRLSATKICETQFNIINAQS